LSLVPLIFSAPEDRDLAELRVDAVNVLELKFSVDLPIDVGVLFFAGPYCDIEHF
jgi:hypothetical protein